MTAILLFFFIWFCILWGYYEITYWRWKRINKEDLEKEEAMAKELWGVYPVQSAFLKTLMDYGGAIIALILFSPVMLWTAWRIKREDGGPVFFRHKRVGRNLRPFYLYKFRTMVPDAELQLKEMLKDDRLRQEFEVSFKFKKDPRITKVGHFLRKTSFDELPQLFNVLKGEMSLVGPRPIVDREIELYYGEENARKIFSLKPGLTGLWQVSGRNDASYERRIALDEEYLQEVGVWTDMKIILKTMGVICRGGGRTKRRPQWFQGISAYRIGGFAAVGVSS